MKLLPVLLCICMAATGNDSLTSTRLLNRIRQLQPKKNGVFPKGIIPSYRLYALGSDRLRADINGFYAGLTAFTLRDIKPELTLAQQKQADEIINGCLSVFPLFQNRKGRPTYNFWRTEDPEIFPNGGWINWFDKSQALPDDLDDTVIFLMAMRAADSTARAVHALMQSFTNKNGVKNTFEEYRDVKAYSTWFGRKTPVEFDIGVHANVLYFVQFYNLPWTSADSASLLLIEQQIEKKQHINAADYISPQYARVPVLLYHISRLMALKPIPSLERLKPQLVEEAREALASAKTFMDEVILSTALLRWGVKPPETKPHTTTSLEALVEEDNFCFFANNVASVLSDRMKKFMTSIKLVLFYNYSPAYNHVLLLENLAWRKRRGL